MGRRRRDDFDDMFPAPSIDRRKRIHRLLDEPMHNKWINCTNMHGSFNGPYITHRHVRSEGITILVYLCVERPNQDPTQPLAQVTVMHCTDFDLDVFIKVEEHEGADQMKQKVFGTTNTNKIRDFLRWYNYKI